MAKKDRVESYIENLYRKDSPLIKQHKDLSIRKKEAAIAAGFDLEKDANELEGMFTLKDTVFADRVIEFMKSQNNLTWYLIVSNEQTFHEYQQAVMKTVIDFKGDKDRLSATQIKTKLLEDSDAIAARLEGYYVKVFSDNDVLEKVKSQSFTPESMARGPRGL